MLNRGPLFSIRFGLALGLALAVAPVGSHGGDPSISSGTSAVSPGTGVALGGVATGFVKVGAGGSIDSLTVGNEKFGFDGSFLAVYSRVDDHAVAKVLAGVSDQELPKVGKVLFQGLYPRAAYQFFDPDLACTVSLEAFSPLIPDDLVNSSLPVVLYSAKLSNPTEKSLDAAVLFSLTCPFPNIPASNPDGDPSIGLPQIVLAGAPRLGFQFTGRASGFGDQLTLSLLTLGSEEVKVSAVPLRDGAVEDRRLVFSDFSHDGVLGNSSDNVAGELPLDAVSRAAALACKIHLAPGEEKTLTFAISWHNQRVAANGIGYASPSFPDAKSVADHALGRFGELREETLAWQRRIVESTLPSALKRHLVLQVAELMSWTAYDRENQLVLHDPLHGGPGLAERLLWQPLIAAFFPELDRDQLRRFASRQLATGEFLDERRGGGVKGNGIPRADLASCFAIGVYSHFQETGDRKFLSEMLPSVTSSMRFSRDLDSDGDGVPNGRTPFHLSGAGGAQSYTASLWLCALKCFEKIAVLQGDVKLASDCITQFHRARRTLVGELWNGRYFERGFSPADAVRDRACGPEQIAGEVFARRLGFPPLTSKDLLGSAVTVLGTSDAVHPFVRACGAAVGRFDLVFGGVGEKTMGWSLLPAIAGFSVEVGAGRIAIAPCPAGDSTEPSTIPLFAAQFWADLVVSSGPAAGDRHLDLHFTRVPAETGFSLRELRFAAPMTTAEEELTLRVTSPRGTESGQLTKSGDSLVFRFHEPLPVSAGTDVFCHLAPRESGAFEVRLTDGVVLSRGAVIDVHGVKETSSGIRFEVTNLGDRPQHLSLQGLPEEWSGQVVFVDGKPIKGVDAARLSAGIDLWVDGPVVRFDEYHELSAVGDRLHDELLGNDDLSEELRMGLRAFRSSVTRFRASERRARSLRIDVLREGRDPLTVGETAAIDGDRAKSRLSRLRTDLDHLRREADAASGTGASRNELLSALHPVELEITIDGESTGEVLVHVTLSNPHSYKIASNLTLSPAGGFRAEAVSDDDEKTEGLRSTFRVVPEAGAVRGRHFVKASARVHFGEQVFRVETESWFGSDAARQWQIIGPFALNAGTAFSAGFPPESELDLAAVYAGKAGPVRWRAVTGAADWLDLEALLGDSVHAVGYAMEYVWAPEAREVLAELRCGGRFNVFVNGTKVDETGNPAPRGGVVLPLTLRSGWNVILLKLGAQPGRFGFRFELTDQNGATIHDLRRSTRLVEQGA